MLKKLLASLCFVLFIVGCSEAKAEIKKVDSDQAIALMEDGAILLDVRTKSEYDYGHIPNAVLLNVDEVEGKIANVVDDKKQAIIVYCRSGNRSAKAAATLVELGYQNVYDLGSINNWQYEIVK